jgi:hypothetical protein
MIGLIVAVTIVSVVYKNNNKKVIKKFLLFATIMFMLLIIGSMTDKNIILFIDRFTVSSNFTNDRGDMYISLLRDYETGSILFGKGTASTYAIYDSGAHNIYVQILHDHGVIGLIVILLFL